jgi:hypothetical protein
LSVCSALEELAALPALLRLGISLLAGSQSSAQYTYTHCQSHNSKAAAAACRAECLAVPACSRTVLKLNFKLSEQRLVLFEVLNAAKQ